MPSFTWVASSLVVIVESATFLNFRAGPEIKEGEGYVFYDVIPDATAVAVVGLGEKDQGVNQSELIHQGKEAVRTAAAGGILNKY